MAAKSSAHVRTRPTYATPFRWRAPPSASDNCRQEHDYSWDFVFLGANMDAVAIGERLGFAPEKSMTYAADGDGVGTAWAATTSYVARRNAAPPTIETPPMHCPRCLQRSKSATCPYDHVR